MITIRSISNYVLENKKLFYLLLEDDAQEQNKL